MTDSEIIRKEKERSLASGMSKQDVLKAISGENRGKLIEMYRRNETGAEKENMDVQHEKNALDLKKISTRKQKKEKPAPVKDRTEAIIADDHTEIVETVPCTEADTVVYDDIIQFYADEYVEGLDETGLKNLYSIQGRVFTGMIKYISNHCTFNATKQDAYTLNNIWKSYTGLCYKYSQVPFLSEFAIMLDIHRDTLYGWINGEGIGKDYCEKVSCTVSDIVKRWQAECKAGRLKGASAGNVGMIFLCKAVDGLVETAPQSVFNPVQLENNVDMLQKLGLKCSENSDNLPALTAAN